MQAGDEFKKAVDLAKNSDIAVMVLGENQDMSGEYASRSTIDLPGRQLELLQAVTATGKPVVLVLLNGRPLDITWAAQNVPSILEAWAQSDAESGPRCPDRMSVTMIRSIRSGHRQVKTPV